MNAKTGRIAAGIAETKTRADGGSRRPAQRGLADIGVGLTIYGTAAALFVFRSPAILGERWSWLVLLLIPILTILMAYLRTGTALAFVLLYAFSSATLLAVQGYRVGWGGVVQVQYILSHFATIFFLVSAVALISVLRSRRQALQEAHALMEQHITHDMATGLLTPAAFKAAASRELNRSTRTRRPFLLLAIDVTGYFGTSQGSSAMATAERTCAGILCTETRGDQDQWTMWKTGVYLGLLTETDYRAVESALGRILSRVTGTPEFDGPKLVEGARFGVASYPDDGITAEALLESALGGKMSLGELWCHLEETTGGPLSVEDRSAEGRSADSSLAGLTLSGAH